MKELKSTGSRSARSIPSAFGAAEGAASAFGTAEGAASALGSGGVLAGTAPGGGWSTANSIRIVATKGAAGSMSHVLPKCCVTSAESPGDFTGLHVFDTCFDTCSRNETVHNGTLLWASNLESLAAVTDVLLSLTPPGRRPAPSASASHGAAAPSSGAAASRDSMPRRRAACAARLRLCSCSHSKRPQRRRWLGWVAPQTSVWSSPNLVGEELLPNLVGEELQWGGRAGESSTATGRRCWRWRWVGSCG